MRFASPMTTWTVGLLCFGMIASCGASDSRLLITLRTDYTPQDDFGEVRVTLERTHGEPLRASHSARGDYSAGRRVANFEVDPGTYSISVVLFDGGEEVAGEIVMRTLRGTENVLVDVCRVPRRCAFPVADGGIDGDVDGGLMDGGVFDAQTDVGLDAPDSCNPRAWYRDADGDDYGVLDDMVEACEAPDGYVGDPGDCDDANEERSPGESEECTGIDEDCDGQVDEDDVCNGCRPQHTAFGRYRICDRLEDREAAATACLDAGESLVEFDNLEEQEALMILSAPRGGHWIGLTGAGGAWRWASGGGASYMSWRDGHPRGIYECAALVSDEWVEVPCGSEYGFICEQP